jgi:ATP-binding cassette subfamily G (WHITE) protein 1
LLFLIAYYIIGLYPAFSVFLLSGVLLVFCAICGTAVGTFISAIFDDVALSLAVLPLVLLPVLLFSGLFVNSGNFPSWLSWLQWGSPVRYAFSGLLRNQFSNYTFNNCPGTPEQCSGQRAIDQLGFDEDLPIGVFIAILAGIYLLLAIGGYFILYVKTRR